MERLARKSHMLVSGTMTRKSGEKKRKEGKETVGTLWDKLSLIPKRLWPLTGASRSFIIRRCLCKFKLYCDPGETGNVGHDV